MVNCKILLIHVLMYVCRSEETEDLTADSAIEDPDTEEVVLMEEPSTSLGQKLRLYKLLVSQTTNFPF